MHVFVLNLIAQTCQRSTCTVTKLAASLSFHFNWSKNTALYLDYIMDQERLANLKARGSANRIGMFLFARVSRITHLCFSIIFNSLVAWLYTIFGYWNHGNSCTPRSHSVGKISPSMPHKLREQEARVPSVERSCGNPSHPLLRTIRNCRLPWRN